MTEQTKHLELKIQVKQKKVKTDDLQRKIETLKTERKNLQSNRTSLGKAACFFIERRMVKFL